MPARGETEVKSAGISDRGLVRENNEDRYLIWREDIFTLYAVADGMGGHVAGEVASALTLSVMQDFLLVHKNEMAEALHEGGNLQPYVAKMLTAANTAVYNEGEKIPEYAGMGTTLTMLLKAGERYWLAHIGDSRACLIRENELIRLTEDHTLVTQLLRNGQIREEETNGHPQRHILTRALGTDDTAQFDILAQTFFPGDKILLCTDGLHGLVEEDEILREVEAGIEPEDILSRLVALANERGGTDNITAVLVYV
jgi:protein phosphatase